jgi:serpin B
MLEGSEKAYMKIKGAKGFVKPYEGGNIAFLALLPPKSTAISRYVKKLTGADLINGYKNRKKTDIIVRTRMPEFNYKYELSLKTPLKRMGIKNAFSETKADFSKMSDQDIHIDDIIHKTNISLTKDGTEAAAVTAVMIKANSILPSQGMTIKTVYLNRPFVYAIIDMKTGIPLFLGVVNQVQ